MELEKTETARSAPEADLYPKLATNMGIELPQDVAEALEKKWGDLSQYALEMLALEGYRSGVLTPEQLHRMLSLRMRYSADAGGN